MPRRWWIANGSGVHGTRQIQATADCALKNIHKFKKVVYYIERFVRHAELPFRSAGESDSC
jgi:hypothetical protein